MNPDQTPISADTNEAEANIASMETRQMMEELLKLTRENHKMLAQERRAKKLESLRGILKIIVLVVILFFAYKFVNPYIQGAKKIYTSVSTKIDTLTDAAKTIQDTSDKLNTAQKDVSGFFSGFKDDLGGLDGLFGNNNN